MEGLVSRSGSVKKFEFLRPFSKATEKTEKKTVLLWISFISNCKQKVCLQQPAMFCLSNLNIDNFLPDLDINPPIVY